MYKPDKVSGLILTALAVGSVYGSPAMALSGDKGSRMPSSLALETLIKVNGDNHQALLDGSKSLIEDISTRGIGFLSDKSLGEKKRESEFRDLLNDSFDMKTIGRFALGRYWRGTTDAQKKEYQKLFNELIVRVYTARFKEYDGQKLEVAGARKDSANDDVIVKSLIIPNSGGQKVAVEWRVRQKNGKFKVVDISVEGVSMALTQRSDFASVIQRGGGDVEALLAHLRK